MTQKLTFEADSTVDSIVEQLNARAGTGKQSVLLALTDRGTTTVANKKGRAVITDLTETGLNPIQSKDCRWSIIPSFSDETKDPRWGLTTEWEGKSAHTDTLFTCEAPPLSEVVSALQQVAQQMSTRSDACPTRTEISGPGNRPGDRHAEAGVTVLHFMLGPGEDVSSHIKSTVGSILSGGQ